MLISNHIPVIRIAFLNVGQGDTIVVSCPETHEAIVVDCNDENVVLDYLMNERIKYLRGIIITHLHADHYKGVLGLLDNWHFVPTMGECEVVVYNSITNPNRKIVDKLLNDIDNHSISQNLLLEEQKQVLAKIMAWCKKTRKGKPALANIPSPFLGFLGTRIDILYPDHSDIDPNPTVYQGNINNLSAILRVRGANSSALLTSDIEPFGWERFIATARIDVRSDVFKFPHHGAWKLNKKNPADVESLLDKVMPSFVVMSVGTDQGLNKNYLHPNKHVFEALQKRNDITLLCTQATSQCDDQVISLRNEVGIIHHDHSLALGYDIGEPQDGCACAGHIIVELGDNAEIIYPNLSFHQSSIIDKFFSKAMCRKNIVHKIT